MRYRSRLILVFATVALLGSLGLGIIIFRINAGNVIETRKNNLQVSAESIAVQMEERLDQMNAIMYYILSDATMLDSITMLGRMSEDVLPSTYINDAQSAIQVGLTTEYIMKNSYRTVFFNQGGFLASSAVYSLNIVDAYNQRLWTDFTLEEIPYLDTAIRADGKSVIIGPHQDLWGVYERPEVFSMMKAIRGDGMGFLEVENQLSVLEKLEKTDTDISFRLIINGDEVLYANTPETPAQLDAQERAFADTLENGVTVIQDGAAFVRIVSEDYPLEILATRSAAQMGAGREQIYLISVMASLTIFAVMLAFIIFWSYVLVKPVRQLQKVVEATNIENLHAVQDMGTSSGGLDEFTELTAAYQSMTNRLDQALQNEKRSAMLQLQAQFDTLQTQVNPHFIYNVLNIISSRAVMADDEVICEMCGSLGNMLRYSTNNRQRDAKVREELEYLRNYFYLLECRYESRLHVSIDIDEETQEMIIPKMTLQQIVENCVKHGFHDTDVDMEITISGAMQPDHWTITILDNGQGVAPERLEQIRKDLEDVRKQYREMEVETEAQIGGIGLRNTYARCLLLFGEEMIFTLQNRVDSSGFEVTVGRRFCL